MLVGVGCNSSSESDSSNGKVTVAVAANMRFAIDDLTAAFEEESGIDVEVSTGPSGTLSSQISEGAPFDLFLSANLKFPKKLHESGDAVAAPKIYATGLLVMWSMTDIEMPKSIENLTDDRFKQIAIADPKGAPYGAATVEALKNAGIWDTIQPKIIYGESVGQVNQYVHLNSVDVGITNKSILLSPKMKNEGKWVEIDVSLYQPIQQGIVILKHGAETNEDNTKKFYDFMFSEKARNILVAYGYGL